MSEEDKFHIQLQKGEDWESLAIALIRQGYKVGLFQDWTKLVVERIWHYPKKENDNRW